MNLYLVQHGQPVAKEQNPERPLSKQGQADVAKLAVLLTTLQVRVKMIFQSGKTRALQSAEILASALPGATVVQRQGISPLDDIQPLVKYLRDMDGDCLVVGHLPYLGKLASYLICGDEQKAVVGFQQGGLVRLEKVEEGQWIITGMILPRMLAALTR